ncbi:MAG: hypothetical protein KGJ06_10110, partial [Pseudomonadota bacterium]|nr:hypothetical protein [Pseudomonadota bacterium]
NAMLPGALFIAISWIPHAKSKGFYAFFNTVCFGIMVFASIHDYSLVTNKYAEGILSHDIMIAQEYHTRWMPAAGLDNQLVTAPGFFEREPVTFAEGAGKAAILSQGSRDMLVHAEVISPQALVELRRFYFPYWETPSPGVRIEESHALLALRLPKGVHDITLHAHFAGRREGGGISLAALALVLGIWRLACRRQSSY